MSIKRKRSGHEEEPPEPQLLGERYLGRIHQIDRDKMFVTCEGVPEEFGQRPPKITKKSQAPPGLGLGSWISFDLMDEWPGQNWGSLLAVNIEAAEAPEAEAPEEEAFVGYPDEDDDVVEVQPIMNPTPKVAAKGQGPAPVPATRASLAAAVEKLRAQQGSVAKRSPAPAAVSQTATIPRAQRQAAASIPRAPVAPAISARRNGGAKDAGLSKSGAVAAFRQAKEAGRTFESGWNSTPAKPQGIVKAQVVASWGKKSKMKDNRFTAPPFQKVFLEAPEEMGPADKKSMLASRAEVDVTVEMPSQVADMYPPITAFEDLQGILPDYAFEGMGAMGIEVPMPIQAQAIPLALAGLDVVGIAKTGSGKTLAYVLPALTHVEAQEPKAKGAGTPMVLILAPTRELAVQIADMVKAVTRFSSKSSKHPGGLSSAVLYGGGHGSKAWQVADCCAGGQLVAATPGRLLDVMDGGDVSLKRVTFFVLDEADRMLECGFEEQVGRIGKSIRSDRHTLFFSATWPSQVQHMAQLMCSSELPPVRILAGQRKDGDGPTSRDDILQEVVVFEQATWEERDNAKQELLYAHLQEVLSKPSHKTLVFVSRKNLADTLAKRLKGEGFRANVMHGGKSQDSRLATLEGFRNGEIQLLVTTDVMGRGLDIPGISHVVIYDMGDIEDYVHRIGRTARGPYGKGHALTFYEYDKKWPNLPRKLMDVLEQSGQEVPPELANLAAGEGRASHKPQGWRSWTPR